VGPIENSQDRAVRQKVRQQLAAIKPTFSSFARKAMRVTLGATATRPRFPELSLAGAKEFSWNR
jgi:hypothetical protein